MTVDLDALARALEDDSSQPFGRYGLRCKTCRLLAALPADDPRSDLIRSYIDGTIEAETVAHRLRGGGYEIGADSIRKHRRGVCKTKRAVA